MSRGQLQQELKKRHPFQSPEVEAVLNVIKTGDYFLHRFGKLFREFGLTNSQYNVLRILRGEGKPLPSLEIADRMVQIVPAITGLIDRLEKQGLVQRRRCLEDRRVVYVELTSDGNRLLDRIDEPELELHKNLVGHMTKKELRELSRLLEKSRSSLTIDKV